MNTRPAILNLWAIGMASLLAGSVIAINIVAHHLDERWDVTADRHFTLSPQTVAVLQSLTKPVEVLAFFPHLSEEEDYFRDLVDSMQPHTDLLEVQFIDPFRQPARARELGIGAQGVVLRQGDRTQRLETTTDEYAVNHALIRLVSETEHLVCFSTGHGEPAPDDDYDAFGFGALVGELDSLNYTAVTVEITRLGEIPSDCSVLVATAVEKDWTPEEMGALATYLAQGGQVLAMPYLPDPEPEILTESPDPAMVANYLDEVTENFNLGLQLYGVWAGPLPVVETDEDHIYPSVPPQAFMVSAPGFQPHAITQAVGGMIATQNTPPLILMGAEGIEMSPLLVTTLGGTARAPQADQSWKPIEAPIMVAAALEIQDSSFIQKDLDGQAGGRMVVLGSPWIAANALIYESPWNKNLVLNSIAWLADEEVQVASRVSTATPTPPMLSNKDADTVQQVLVLLTPGLALLCAMGTWRRRRSL